MKRWGIRMCALIAAAVMLINCAFAESRFAAVRRLQASDFVFDGKSYSGKKTAMIEIAELLLADGFEPAFAAGVLANVAKEGSFGKFENIWGYTQTRLLQVFPNLQTCAQSGLTHKNYIAHMKGFKDYDQCGHDHSEYAQFSNTYIYNGASLKAVRAMTDRYKGESWKAKFGLGSLQWTGARQATLLTYYEAEAAGKDTITADQCRMAELKMIENELKGSYKFVYNSWQSANAKRDTPDAAYDAGYKFCFSYEVPASRETRSVERGTLARAIYAVMMPSGLKYDPDRAIVLPNSIRFVGKAAFANTGAEVIVINKNCLSVAETAFDDCGNLTRVIDYSGKVTKVPAGVELIRAE